MRNLVWMEKSRQTRIRDGIDVTLSVLDNGHGQKSVAFYFRNGSEKKITDSDYITCALDDDRLYFTSATASNGWKLGIKTGTAGTRTFRFTISENIRTWKEAVGDYILEYDREEGLFFINLKERV